MNPCNATVVLDSSAQIFIVVLGFPCLLIGIFDVVALLAMRLHTKVLYRLVLYKVICEVAFSIAMSGAAIKYERVPLLCIDAIFIFMVTACTMLCFCFSMHLLLFAVCYKNPKVLEPLYVAVTVGLSTVLSAFYLAFVQLDSSVRGCAYDTVMAGACTVVFLLLMLSSANLMVTTVTVMYRCWCKHETSFRRQYKATFKETIPFLLYPTVYGIFGFLLLSLSIHNAVPIAALKSTHNLRYTLPQGFCLLGCVLVMVHLSVVRFLQNHEQKPPMVSRLEAQNGMYGSV